MYSVEPDEWIVALQWTILPLLEFRNYLVGEGANGRCRNIDAVQLFEVAGYTQITGTQSIERQYLALNLVRHMGLVLLD